MLLVTNSTAIGHAMCRHVSAQEHLAALNSDDERLSAAAIAEESAGEVAAKSGSVSDLPLPAAGMINERTAFAARRRAITALGWIVSGSWSPSHHLMAPPSRPPLR